MTIKVNWFPRILRSRKTIKHASHWSLPVFLDIRHPWGLSQKGFISLVSNSFIANVFFSLPHCQIADFTLLLFISLNTRMPKAFIYCSSPLSHLFLDLFLLRYKLALYSFLYNSMWMSCFTSKPYHW